MDMRIFNSLSRKIEDFEPLHDKSVGMYTCGPTVYDYTHLGHGRKYTNDDVLRRALTWLGYSVTHVQNITDVGHLVSDADEGEDKLEKGARKTGKTVWEVADFYTKYFEDTMQKLNILPATYQPKATEHIQEQIDLIQKLFTNGFAYDTPEAVYFDVSKFPDYGKLFGQDLTDKNVAVRSEVETGEYKRHPADFALWFKRVGRFADHTMHWDSPWGDGFPGWHIECSAMSMKYLGEQFDIHTGGEDHLSVHHPNEIAQSEGATGKKPFVKYWVHDAFLKVDGQKMSKSLGNYLKLDDIIDRGFDPLALRYLFLTAHYRKPMNFTFESLEAATQAYNKLKETVRELAKSEKDQTDPKAVTELRDKFKAAIEDDMNTAQALAVVWSVVKSDLSVSDKLQLLFDFDQVLGFRLEEAAEEKEKEIPQEAQDLLTKRNNLRSEKQFAAADEIRQQLEKMGYTIKDSVSESILVRK